MGIFREIEDFFDETPRVVVPNPFSNVEVELPEEWQRVTSEDLGKSLGIKLGEIALGAPRTRRYEPESEPLFD